MVKTIKFGIISLIIIMLSGCNNSDDEIKTEQSIIGNWKLIEVYSDVGDGSGDWNPVENGYTYSFSSNGEFSSTRFPECSSGTYTINSNELTLVFDCNGFTTGIENPEGTFVENYTFESNTVILVPTYMICDEGCGWKFKKMN
ncbi:lipocalin family protein [Gelidibacter maritimus]|uniref:Lipocalin family protein n=1 Tax=Gelidibacter maritimus TaxID=2761487 RepID=A0A7W2M2R0_9FLAO|nr:lipocalin family protein [Gelidibacter maritimus]MBA6151620.1 lipocalin family protein [Gelidibacter maritimus]